MSFALSLDNAQLVTANTRILDNVTWASAPSQHWVILGPNGAGKTSLVRAASGRLRLTSGHAQLDGVDVDTIPPAELATRVSLMSASSAAAILSGQSVKDLVRTAAWGISVHHGETYDPEDNTRAMDLLDAFGIAHLAERAFRTLSEGEAQRVLLARSLMSDPEILILDEPSAGLDLGARELLIGALEEIMCANNAPQLILVTHQLEEIPAGITHAALMARGSLLASGPIEDVITGATLSTAYELPLAAGKTSGRWWAHGLPRN